MKLCLRDIKRNITKENTDDLLFMMIDCQIEAMKRKNLEPNLIQLTICEHNEFNKFIWLLIYDTNCTRQHESIWINEYDYAFIRSEVDETPFAKQEVYRLKKILKKHYPKIRISTDLRGC